MKKSIIFIFTLFLSLPAMAQTKEQSATLEEFIKRFNNGNDDIVQLLYSGKSYKDEEIAEYGRQARKMRDLYGTIHDLTFKEQSGDTLHYGIRFNRIGKKTISFIFKDNLIEHFTFYQDNKDYDHLMSVEEMKEDALFYFAKLYELHPNPYYYCSGYDFDQKKAAIMDQLSTPMTVREFILILAEINACLDIHSAIDYFNTFSNAAFNFPDIIINDQTVSTTNGRIIESINGIPVCRLTNFYSKFQNPKLQSDRYDYFFEELFSGVLHYFNIWPPYTAKFSDGSTTGLRNEKTPSAPVLSFNVYPGSSTAVINIFSFLDKEGTEKRLTSFRNEIDKHKIENVFINVTYNGGGDAPPKIAYDLVTHDTVYTKYRRQRKNGKIEKIHNIRSLPYRNNTDRTLFVIQGPRTYSAAEYFCREIQYNQLGVLVGANAGGMTKDFTSMPMYHMPNSGFQFGISGFYVDYSDTCPEDVLKPDLYWDVHHKAFFSEEELIDIANTYKNNHLK